MRCAISHGRIFWQCLRGNDLLWVIRNFCHSNFCHSNFCLIPFFSPPTLQHSFIFCGVALHCSEEFFFAFSILIKSTRYLSESFSGNCLALWEEFHGIYFLEIHRYFGSVEKKKKDCRFSICCSKGTKKTFLGGILHFRDQRRLWCKNCAMIQKRFRFYKTLMTIVHFSYFALRWPRSCKTLLKKCHKQRGWCSLERVSFILHLPFCPAAVWSVTFDFFHILPLWDFQGVCQQKEKGRGQHVLSHCQCGELFLFWLQVKCIHTLWKLALKNSQGWLGKVSSNT